MGRDVASCAWPLARLGEAFGALRAGTHAELSEPAANILGDGDALDRWIGAAAEASAWEAEAATMPYSGLARSISAAAPALFQTSRGFILLVRANSRSARVLAPDLSFRSIATKALAAEFCAGLETPLASEADALLEAAGIAKGRRAKVRDAIVRERLQSRQIGGCWLLRLPPGSDFRAQLREAGVWRRLAMLAGAHLAQYSLFLGAWWVLGFAALNGRIDQGWLLAWALMLLTMVPLRMLATWLQGSIAIRAGAVLKQRLLAGALSLEPDEIRSEGAGQLLGRVLESQQVEALALSGGFLALVASIEFILAGAVLFAGGSWREVLLLIGWLGGAALLAWRYFQRNEIWTTARLGMTHELVERMVGHRTRLAQQRRERWHDGEDGAVEGYLGISRKLDRAAALFLAAIARGWLVIAVLALAPVFVYGAASTTQLAVTVGGILLAYRAFRRLTGGLWQLTGATIAWQRTKLLFDAAARGEARSLAGAARRGGDLPTAPSRPRLEVDALEPRAPANCGAAEQSRDSDLPASSSRPRLAIDASEPRAPANGTAAEQSRDSEFILDARQIAYRYAGRGQAVLRGCNLRVARGDRVLLEGPSGGGKSTLAAVLTGMRTRAVGRTAVERDGAGRRGRGGVAEGHRERAAISRKSRFERDIRVQFDDGIALAAAARRFRKDGIAVPRAWPRRSARAHAQRTFADGRRYRVAVIARGTQPPLYCPHAAAKRRCGGAGRELCGPRSRKSSHCGELRPGTDQDFNGDRAPLIGDIIGSHL